MRYKIEGESNATGQPVTVIVEADSTLSARKQADAMSIDIVTLGIVDDHDYTDQKPAPIHSTVSHKSTLTIVLIALVGVFAVMILFGMAAFMFLAVDSSAPAAQPVQLTQPAPGPVLIEPGDTIDSIDGLPVPLDPPPLHPPDAEAND